MGRVFLLQKLSNGHCDADTETIRTSIDYVLWRDKSAAVAYEEASDIHAGLAAIKTAYDSSWMTVPVGSMEFVNEFLSTAYGESYKVKAINVPEALRKPEWLGRRIEPCAILDEDIFRAMQTEALFIKPALYAKEFDALVLTRRNASMYLPQYEGRKVFVSEVLPSPILAEWRIFVYRGRIVGIKPYILDEWVFPDKEVVNDMVRTYTDAPPAYTLDVAVIQSGKTLVIEVHNFISCGLYGLESNHLLPTMLSAAWQYELR